MHNRNITIIIIQGAGFGQVGDTSNQEKQRKDFTGQSSRHMLHDLAIWGWQAKDVPGFQDVILGVESGRKTLS